MSNETFVIKYANFAADIIWSDEDLMFVGYLRLGKQNHSACFSAPLVAGLENTMKEAVEAYLEMIEEFEVDNNMIIIFWIYDIQRLYNVFARIVSLKVQKG